MTLGYIGSCSSETPNALRKLTTFAVRTERIRK